MEHKTTVKELEHFKAADMNEVVRLRKIEIEHEVLKRAAKNLLDWFAGTLEGGNDDNYIDRLRKALQGD